MFAPAVLSFPTRRERPNGSPSSAAQCRTASRPPKIGAATGDPRRSILERYPSAQSYVAAITAAVRQLVEERLMLEEDIERAVAAAADWGRRRHDLSLE